MEEEIIINTEVKNADKSEKQLKDIADATNDAEQAGEEYEGTLASMGGELEVFGVSLNGIIGGFKNSIGAIRNSVKSLKTFKIALASTGIGLLVIALGSLVAWMSTSQEGANFLNDAMKAIGIVIKGIIGLYAQLGKAMVQVFKGDFKGAMETAKGAVTGLVEGITTAITATMALEKELRRIQMAQAKATVLIAANNAEIAKNKRVIEDTTKSTNERIRAAERNAELIAKNQQFQEDLAFDTLEAERERVRIDNEQHGRNTTLLADQLTLSDLAAQVIETQTEGNEKVIEFEVKLLELYALQREEEEQRLAIANLKNEETVKSTELVKMAQMDEEANQKASLSRMTKNVDDYNKNKGEQRKADLKIAEEYAELEAQMAVDLFGALAGLAGQNTHLGKALAIVEATMNTYKAVTVALNAKTMTQRILGVAFATATGLKAVNDIKGTPIPQVEVVSTPFAKGGLINGASHGEGGVWINAEGGEGVINKKSMGVGWIRDQVSYLNQLGGGVPMMASGGVVPSGLGTSPFINIERAIRSGQTVLVLDDLDKAQKAQFATRITTTL